MRVEFSESADLERLRKLVDEACKPALPTEMAKILTRMALTTSHPTPWSEAKLTAYLEVLSEYPGDAVMETLTNWHKRRAKWFPTVPELVESIEIKARRRLRIREALREEIARRADA